MTSDRWYEAVGAADPISQGDLVLQCPALNRLPSAVAQASAGLVDVATLTEFTLRDVVILTQACDLEHDKLRDEVLCPAPPVSQFRAA